MQLGRSLFYSIAIATVLLLSACASHEGFEINSDGSVEPYGFFSGFWHGLILPIVFASYLALWPIAGIIYAVWLAHDLMYGQHSATFIDLPSIVHFIGEPNTGLSYFIGYLIGLSQSLGGGGTAAQKNL